MISFRLTAEEYDRFRLVVLDLRYRKPIRMGSLCYQLDAKATGATAG